MHATFKVDASNDNGWGRLRDVHAGTHADKPSQLARAVAASLRTTHAGIHKYNENHNPSNGQFAPTGSGVADAVAPKHLQEKMLASIKASGGFTFDPRTEEVPKNGYAVGVFPTHAAIYDAHKFTPADVDAWMKKNESLLKDKRSFIGGWVHDGKVYLDVTHVYPHEMKDVAMAVARKKNQIAIADLGALYKGNTADAFINIGGTGEVGKLDIGDLTHRVFMLFDAAHKATEVFDAIKSVISKRDFEDRIAGVISPTL